MCVILYFPPLQATLHSLAYFYVTNNTEPLPGERVVTITVADGQFSPVTFDLFIEVIVINNNAPVLHFAGAASVTYTERAGSPEQLPVGALMQPRIVDLDNNDVLLMERATVILVNPRDGGNETLSMSATVSSISVQGELMLSVTYHSNQSFSFAYFLFSLSFYPYRVSTLYRIYW